MYPIDYEVGDLVIVLHQIDWVEFTVYSAELAFVVEVYRDEKHFIDVYDMKIRTLAGGELGVWFAEVRKLVFEDYE